MDYTTTEINKPEFVKVGTNGQRLLNSTGTLLPPWRWTRNRKLDNGGGQYSCPQCAGRVTTNAKTHIPNVVTNKTAPFLPTTDEYCCGGMVSVGVDRLDACQDIPFGTPA